MHSKRRYYFLKVVETGNITRAAEQLMVSQPSLTQYLNKLEKEMEIKLLDRNFTPLVLTSAGKLYYDYLREESIRENEFNIALNALRQQAEAPLRIGIPAQTGYEVTQKIQPIISKYCSNVTFSIEEGTSKTVVDALLKGEIELGFFHNFNLDKKSKEELTIHSLAPEKVFVMCNSKNPVLAGKKTTPSQPMEISPEMVKSQLFYTLPKTYVLRDVIEYHMKEHGILPASTKTLSELHSILAVIIDSPDSGIAYVPDYFIERTVNKNLVDNFGFLRFGGSDFNWDFSLAYKKTPHLSKKAKLVINNILQHYGEF